MNKTIKTYRNEDIMRIMTGIPGKNHKHLRTIVETEDEFLIFQEATIAAIVRAYIAVKNDPCRESVELRGEFPVNIKPGYAKWQLLETKKPENELLEEIEEIMER
jgi:hypothetical protein